MRIQIENLSGEYAVKTITQEDIDVLYEFCKGNSQYYEHMKMQPTPENLGESMVMLPPGKTLEDKYFVGFWQGEVLVAILDMIDGYPNDDTAYIGWFMMNQAYQGNGAGTKIVQEIFVELKRSGFLKARLCHVKGNCQAEHFWLKNGFVATGHESDAGDYIAVEMEKEL